MELEMRFETKLNEVTFKELINISREMDQKVHEELVKTNLPKEFIIDERDANTSLRLYSFLMKLWKNEYNISLEDLENYFKIIKHALWERVEDLKAIGAYEKLYAQYEQFYNMVFDSYYINKYYKKGGR